MRELGLRMKERRESAGLTLRDIEQATKIGIRQLEHMEAGRFDQLPAGLFARNFIRQYCALVGMDPEEILEALEPAPDKEREAAGSHGNGRGRSRGWAVVLTVLVILLSWAGYRWWRTHQVNIPDLHPVAQPVNAESGVSPVKEPARADQEATLSAPVSPSAEPKPVQERHRAEPKPSPPAAMHAKATSATSEPAVQSTSGEGTASTPAELVFYVSERCWIHLSSLKQDMDFILEPGERYRVRCEFPIRVTLGNAPVVRLTMNGQPVPIPTGEKVLRDYELPHPVE